MTDPLGLVPAQARRTSAGPVVVKIIGMATGGPCPYDDQYLVEYDPERDGETPDGRPMIAHIVTTDDPAEARHFADFREATECWKRVCERSPRRPDGEPNRPLTAFSVEFLPAEKAQP